MYEMLVLPFFGLVLMNYSIKTKRKELAGLLYLLFKLTL